MSQRVLRKGNRYSLRNNRASYGQGFEWQSAHGALYWLFNGETLAEQRSRMEDEEFNALLSNTETAIDDVLAHHQTPIIIAGQARLGRRHSPCSTRAIWQKSSRRQAQCQSPSLRPSPPPLPARTAPPHCQREHRPSRLMMK